MTPFVVRRHAPVAPEVLWRAITDFASHGKRVPLTRMHVDEGAPRVGWGFTGLTGVGPLSFADPMLLTRWEAPSGQGTTGRFRLVKTGRVLGGWAEVEVVPDAQGGCTATWTESLWPRPALLGALVAPLTNRVGAALFTRVLDGMIADAEQGEARSR